VADGAFSAFAWHRGVLSERCTLDPYEGVVMLALVRFANEQGVAFPGFAKLCKATRVGRTKLVACLAALEARGLFKRRAQTHGQGLGSNTYTLPAAPPDEALGLAAASSPRALGKPAPTSPPGALGSPPGALVLGRPADLVGRPANPICLFDQTSGSNHGTGEVRTPAAAGSKRSQKNPKQERVAKWRRVPSSWQPNDAHRAIAAQRGLDLAEQVEIFRDHEFAQPKSDADAAFRNWLKRSFASGKSGASKLDATGRNNAGDWKPRMRATSTVQRGVANEAEANAWGTQGALFEQIGEESKCPF